MRAPIRLLTTVILAGLLAACGDGREGAAEPVIDPGDKGRYAPAIDPADFTDVVDNPYLPLTPGARWVYEGEVDGEAERIEVVVLPERRVVMGISAVVVRDTVTQGGALVEDTRDWFAQDEAGNVWYLGEESQDYEDGKVVSTDGSWEAGVDGALPGIVMPARPVVGHAYRQEFYEGEAEDLGEIVQLDGVERVPFGPFTDLLVTKDWNPLDPDTVEHKYYAEGVGLVLETVVRGGEGRVELVEFTTTAKEG